MTLIQLISHTDQMEAHRRDFALYWEQVILPTMGQERHDPEVIAASQAAHWAIWRRQHHLLPR